MQVRLVETPYSRLSKQRSLLYTLAKIFIHIHYIHLPLCIVGAGFRVSRGTAEGTYFGDAARFLFFCILGATNSFSESLSVMTMYNYY